jgi:hypothetical protein
MQLIWLLPHDLVGIPQGLFHLIGVTIVKRKGSMTVTLYDILLNIGTHG